MPQQSSLFPERAKTKLELAAEKWIVDHPEVMAEFERRALLIAAQGKRFGIGQLAEVIRWHFRFERKGGEDPKLNNNHRAYIARELIRRHAHLADFIETRVVTGPAGGKWEGKA